MSIATEITRINNNISSAYTGLNNKGATLPQTQNSANLRTTIDSIPYYPPANYKAVNFYDYDGTLLYSYSTSEISQLQELPPLPTHKNLISVGWNFTLSEILSSVEKYGECDIGATYRSEDRKTRLFITLSSSLFLSPTLYFSLSEGTVTIDWGDNSTVDVIIGNNSTSTNYNQSHNYAKTGDYIISLSYEGTKNCFLGQNNSTTNGIFGNFSTNSSSDFIYINSLYKIYLGDSTGFNSYALSNTLSLKELVIDYGKTTIGEYVFQGCVNLQYLILPTTVKNLGNYSFYKAGLQKIILHSNITALGIYNCYNNNLRKIFISSKMVNLPTNSLNSCYFLTQVKIPNNVQMIRAGLFANCYNLVEIDLTDYEDSSDIPTLQNVNAFSNTTNLSKIWVKNASMKTAFQGASNWTNFSTLFDIKSS